jgi:hypothetical protein
LEVERDREREASVQRWLRGEVEEHGEVEEEFCLHVAGIPESPLGHEHRYILPIAGLVHRLGQIATGAAGPGLHLMLCNTQSPPDLGFHWFFVAAQYEAARPTAEPVT